jgi:hypothetical protein
MEEYFEYRLKASGGWSKAALTLSDNMARIQFRSASMGQPPIGFIMHCEHIKYSEFHGALSMTALEQYGTYRNEYGADDLTQVTERVNVATIIDPSADEESIEILNRLVLEYIRLPQPQQTLEPAGGYFGLFQLTETFSLLLMIHDAGFWYTSNGVFEKTRLHLGLQQLDKMHMEQKPSPSDLFA